MGGVLELTREEEEEEEEEEFFRGSKKKKLTTLPGAPEGVQYEMCNL